MGKPSKQCEHDAAYLIDDRDIAPAFKGEMYYFCPECGAHFTPDGETVGDPTQESGDPHSPKVLPLRGRGTGHKGGVKGRSWTRDPSLKVEVACQWPMCNNRFMAWKMSHEEKMQKYCPQLHLPMDNRIRRNDRHKRWQASLKRKS